MCSSSGFSAGTYRVGMASRVFLTSQAPKVTKYRRERIKKAPASTERRNEGHIAMTPSARGTDHFHEGWCWGEVKLEQSCETGCEIDFEWLRVLHSDEAPLSHQLVLLAIRHWYP